MIKIKKRKIYFLFLTVICSVFLILPSVCFALEWKDAVDFTLGWVASAIVSVLGGISGIVIASIISIATYNDFINQKEIVTAWQIIRDFSNMWFILILLVIAFATILRIETYNMKKWLPKLLIMAVLINFSRTICGVMIDFSQVVMLTFVNTFATTGGTFVGSLQMKNFLDTVYYAKTATTGADPITAGKAAQAYILACVFMLIAVVVLVSILIVFLMRLIMLWILIALSPLAFMLSSFPQGQSYASRYWGEFTKYLINGPVLAFFLWLSLSVAGNLDANSITKGTAVQGLQTGIISVMNLENFVGFIMSVGFMVGGLMISQQIGGIGASWGMSTVRNLGSKGLSMAKAPFRATGAVAKFGGGVALDYLSKGLGVDLNIPRVIAGVKRQMKQNQEDREFEVRKSVLERADESGSRVMSTLAHLSTGDLAWKSISSLRGNKVAAVRTIMGNKWAQPREALKKAEEDRGRMWSKEDRETYDKKLESKNIEYEKTKEATRAAINDRGVLQANLKTNTPEYKEAEKKVAEAEKREQELKKEISALENDPMAKGENYQPERAEKLDKQIAEYKRRLKEYEIPGMGGFRQMLHDKEIKKGAEFVPDTADPSVLLDVADSALKTGNKGAVAQAFLKAARNGDYNDIQEHYGLGTGREGMLQLAKMLEKDGKFDRQMALKLVAQIGGIAKNLNHFAAFGTVKMKNGRYEEATDNEYQTAMLSEMLKKEPQEFARNVNRLGLGEFAGPEPDEKNWKHDAAHWEPSAATIAYLKLNGDKLAEQYLSRGQQNAIEFLASRLDVLEKGGISPDSVLVENIKLRSKTQGKGTDAAAQIREVKSQLGIT